MLVWVRYSFKKLRNTGAADCSFLIKYSLTGCCFLSAEFLFPQFLLMMLPSLFYHLK